MSRESSTVGGISAFDESEEDNGVSLMNADHEESQDAFGREAENTAGVGTRAYASPEQMKGSNYDASTDIFSLGVICKSIICIQALVLAEFSLCCFCQCLRCATRCTLRTKDTRNSVEFAKASFLATGILT